MEPMTGICKGLTMDCAGDAAGHEQVVSDVGRHGAEHELGRSVEERLRGGARGSQGHGVEEVREHASLLSAGILLNAAALLRAWTGMAATRQSII